MTKIFRNAAVAALVALSACDSGTSDTTSLSILLKDAPDNIVAAVVTIDEVNLAGPDGAVVLTGSPVTVDLLTLANDAMDLVTDVSVPSGTYQQLRFVISGGYIEVDNGDGTTSIYASEGYDQVPAGRTVTGELQMPSFAQSGLKVNMADGALELTSDQEILLVDFDVRQSFGHAAGNSGRWVMHPVITGGELGATGGVHVTLRNATGIGFALGTASVSLTDMNGTPVGTPLTPTDVDGDGVFDVDFGLLAPGSYRVLVAPPSGTLTIDPAVPYLVTVTSGQATTVALTVTATS